MSALSDDIEPEPAAPLDIADLSSDSLLIDQLAAGSPAPNDDRLTVLLVFWRDECRLGTTRPLSYVACTQPAPYPERSSPMNGTPMSHDLEGAE